MRSFLIAVIIVLIAWAQLTFPATLAPWHVIPDITFFMVLGLALYYQPVEQVPWWALLAGLSLDLWHPSHFGIWTIASLFVASVALVIHVKILPRVSRPGLIVAGAVSLLAGLLVLFVGATIGADFGLIQGVKLFSRMFLLRFAIDLVLLMPAVYFVRRLATWLNPYQGALRPVRGH